MEAARDHTDETICLIVREEWDRVALHTLPSTRNVRFVLEVGDRRPLHTGAAGTCLTMGLSEDERTQLLARVEDFDDLGHNSVGVGEIRERQRLVRENGWAYARGEWSPEAAGAAAPIVDASGGVRGAISVVMPITRASNQYLETCARTAQITAQRTADELSKQHQ